MCLQWGIFRNIDSINPLSTISYTITYPLMFNYRGCILATTSNAAVIAAIEQPRNNGFTLTLKNTKQTETAGVAFCYWFAIGY